LNPSEAFSTGDTTPFIYARKTGTYTGFVRNEYGCWGLTKITVDLEQSYNLIKIFGTNYFCEGYSTSLSIDDNFFYNRLYPDSSVHHFNPLDSLIWFFKSNDGSTPPEGLIIATGEFKININKPGKYWVTARTNNNCPAYSDTLEVIKRAPSNPKIIGAKKLCPGDTITLSTEDEYDEYLWSSGLNNYTTRSFKLWTPGYIELIVFSKYCGGGFAWVYIPRAEIIFSGREENFDLGFKEIYTSKIKTMSITNAGADTIIISSIYTSGDDSTNFEITTQPPIPLMLLPKSSININIKFKPDALKNFKTRLLLNTSSPCQKQFITDLSGIGILGDLLLTVSLPDTAAQIGANNFQIPLRANTNNKIDQSYKFNLTAYLKFNPSAFLTDSITKGTIIKNIFIPDPADDIQNPLQNLIELKIDSINFISLQEIDSIQNLHPEWNTITKLNGRVLLGSNKISPLIIDSIKIEPYLPLKSRDGSLSLYGICIPNLSKVKFIIFTDFYLIPNPASESVEIRIISDSEKEWGLYIYNITGTLAKEPILLTFPSTSNMKATIDIKDLNPGIYTIILQTRTEKIAKQLTIIR
jgi:hypothetical protein